MRLNHLATLIAISTVLQTASAYAVNRCTDADGKVTYQDAACPGSGTKIDVVPANRSTDAAATLKKSTTKQRAELDAYHAKQEKEEKEAKERETADKKRNAQCQVARETLMRRRARFYGADDATISADATIQIQRDRMKELGCTNIP